MNARFLFSTKAHPSTHGLLAALAAAKMITASSCIQVFTSDEQVAALLARLDDAERIMDGDAMKAIDTPPPEQPAPVVKTKTEIPRRGKYNLPVLPDVECPVCRRPVSPRFMLRNGSMCKNCLRKAKKTVKGQPREMSHELGSWTSEKPEFGNQERAAEFQAKPKEKIDLSKLAGKKIG